MDHIRWFAPNRFCTLPVPVLRRFGFRIALEGAAPARLAVAADGVCGVAAHEYARRHRCPVLLYIWDLPPWRLGTGKPDLIFEWGARVHRLPRAYNRYPERAGYYSKLRFVARRAAAVWCPSTNTVADLSARWGADAVRVPFCFDSDRFVRGARAPRDASAISTLLCIGRLVPHKNHAVVLRAAARLSARPEVRIIGRGPDAPALRRLAADLGIALQLDEGWASEEEIRAAYEDARVVVCPSRFEGFGLTPMEGLAMGRPVVASDIPPHREWVAGAARLVRPDDVEAWAGAIEAALGQPPDQKTTRPAALDDLTIEACAARFLPGLERLLA